jgi:hypothetical protein
MKTQMLREFSLHLSRVGKDACEVVLTRIHLSKVLPAADREIVNSTFTHGPVGGSSSNPSQLRCHQTQDSGGLVAQPRRIATRAATFAAVQENVVKITPEVRSNSVWLPKTQET